MEFATEICGKQITNGRGGFLPTSRSSHTPPQCLPTNVVANWTPYLSKFPESSGRVRAQTDDDHRFSTWRLQKPRTFANTVFLLLVYGDQLYLLWISIRIKMVQWCAVRLKKIAQGRGNSKWESSEL